MIILDLVRIGIRLQGLIAFPVEVEVGFFLSWETFQKSEAIHDAKTDQSVCSLRY